MKVLFKAMAILGAVLLLCAVGGMDYCTKHMLIEIPAYIYFMLFGGLSMMIPAYLYGILKGGK